MYKSQSRFAQGDAGARRKNVVRKRRKPAQQLYSGRLADKMLAALSACDTQDDFLTWVAANATHRSSLTQADQDKIAAAMANCREKFGRP